jgi:hypothetical protein
MFGRCLAILTVVGAVTACTTLFEDDFEAYPSGASVGVTPNPDTSAPGEILASGDPALYRVQGGSALEGSQSLVLGFADQGPPNQGPVLSFVSDPPQPVAPQGGAATSRRPVFFSWRGRISAVSDGSFSSVDVREAGDLLLIVAVNDARVIIQKGTSQEVIDGDFTSEHRIVIRVDAGGYFQVEVTGQGGGGDVCGGVSGCAFTALPGPIDLPSLQFQMRTFQQVPQGDTYRVDDVRTSQRDF